MSSLDNVSSEAIQCIAFADTYTKKSGNATTTLFYWSFTVINFGNVDVMKLHATLKYGFIIKLVFILLTF